jgi:hypothetical protein
LPSAIRFSELKTLCANSTKVILCHYIKEFLIMPTSRKPFRRVLIACVIVLGLIALGEVVLQIFGFGHPALVVLNDASQYELMPNQHIRRLWPLSDSVAAHVNTNQYGMRSLPVSPVKPANTLRIYFLGDSITYGTTQVDQSQIFTDLARRELPAIVHQPVEVLDGAISGWAISNELGYLKEHGPLQADRLVLVLNDGDPAQPLSPQPHGYGIPSTEFNPKWGYEELWFRVVRPQLQGIFRKHGIHLLRDGNLQDPGVTVGDDAAVRKQNLQYLGQMRDYLQQNHVALSILFIPFPGIVSDPVQRENARVGKSAVAAWAAQNQVPFLYLGPWIMTSNPSAILLRDHAHFNVKGNREVADAIERNWAVLTSTPSQAASTPVAAK